MASFIAWVDYSQIERDRMRQAVALFREHQTVDELGVGSIRDIIANRLFPGTSTIQTRLRYFLFVPWIYREMERSGRADQVEAEGRRRELALVRPLVDAGDLRGVMGQDAGELLQRLPSSVYWSGLQSWGLFSKSWSLEEYRLNIPQIRKRRASERPTDDKGIALNGFTTWTPHLPDCPPDFPHGLSFTLTHDEAEFLRSRLKNAHPASLLSQWMNATRAQRPILHQTAPWDASLALPPQLQHELAVAKKFALLMHGAVRLYNIALAEQVPTEKAEQWREFHRNELRHWQQQAVEQHIFSWNLNELWAFCRETGRDAGKSTKDFVEGWYHAVGDVGLEQVGEAPALRALVRRREIHLKGARSRFRNPRALERWGGASGTALMTYRWRTVATFLGDLYSALDGGTR